MRLCKTSCPTLLQHLGSQQMIQSHSAAAALLHCCASSLSLIVQRRVGCKLAARGGLLTLRWVVQPKPAMQVLIHQLRSAILRAVPHACTIMRLTSRAACMFAGQQKGLAWQHDKFGFWSDLRQPPEPLPDGPGSMANSASDQTCGSHQIHLPVRRGAGVLGAPKDEQRACSHTAQLQACQPQACLWDSRRSSSVDSTCYGLHLNLRPPAWLPCHDAHKGRQGALVVCSTHAPSAGLLLHHGPGARG